MKIGGRSLIQISADTIKESGFFSLAICSTDDPLIGEIAMNHGLAVPSLRPKHLATDEAATVEAVVHVLEELEDQGEQFDWVFVVQATSPLLSAQDLLNAKSFIESGKFSSVMSGFLVPSKFHPSTMVTVDSSYLASPIFSKGTQLVRRQEMPTVFARSGLVYAAEVRRVLETKELLPEPTGFVEVPFARAISIDTELDFLQAKELMERGG